MVDVLVFTRGTGGLFVAGPAYGELVKLGLRVNRMVLPVAVTADYQEVIQDVGGKPRADMRFRKIWLRKLN